VFYINPNLTPTCWCCFTGEVWPVLAQWFWCRVLWRSTGGHSQWNTIPWLDYNRVQSLTSKL